MLLYLSVYKLVPKLVVFADGTNFGCSFQHQQDLLKIDLPWSCPWALFVLTLWTPSVKVGGEYERGRGGDDPQWFAIILYYF